MYVFILNGIADWVNAEILNTVLYLPHGTRIIYYYSLILFGFKINVHSLTHMLCKYKLGHKQ